MAREPEAPAIKTRRMRWMSLVNHYGHDDPRTVAAFRELQETRADVAEADARRLRQAANLLATEDTAMAS
jgi:hypothetical protein